MTSPNDPTQPQPQEPPAASWDPTLSPPGEPAAPHLQPPPYQPPPTQPQPQYGQYAPGYGPDGPVPPPGYAPPPPQGYGPPSVWQTPQYPQDSYGGTPVWHSTYGQGPQGQQYVTAGAGARLGARVIDYLIVQVVSVALQAAIFPLFGLPSSLAWSLGDEESMSLGELGTSFAVTMSVALLGLAYYGYFIGVKGATPGKRAVGITVIDARHGGTIGFWRAVLREFVLGLSAMLCFIGYFSLFFDNSGWAQGWHDKAASSRVVKG